MRTTSTLTLGVRRVAVWAALVALLGVSSCFRSVDLTKVPCSNESPCPTGYSCARTAGSNIGHCAPGSTDAARIDQPASTDLDGKGLEAGDSVDVVGDSQSRDLRDVGAGGADGLSGGTAGSTGGTIAEIDAPLGGTGGTGGTGDTGGTGGTTTTDTTTGTIPDAGSVLDAPLTPTDAALGVGLPCKVNGDCSTGKCIDEVCCATDCGGCNACSSRMTGKDDGTCAPVQSGIDPHEFCSDETTTNPCGNDGTCDGKGACRKVGTSKECGAASCSSDGKSFIAAVTCDGNGKCSTATPQDCGGALCSATSGCLKNCTDSLQCGKGYYCNTALGTCAPLKKNGTIASKTEECSSGVIADGVCCDKDCTGCSACTLALNFQGGGAQDGQCLPVAAGKSAPHSACSASASAPCGQDGTCDGIGGCHYPAAGVTCGDPSCAGAALTTRTCNSSHVCLSTTVPCSGSLVCETSTTCKVGSCGKDQDCSSGYCVDGSCQSVRKVGDACGGTVECPNGYCVDGYCCNDKCDGDCQSCKQTPGQCKTTSTARTSCPGTGTCGKKYCDGTHASCVFPGSATACPGKCSTDWAGVVSSSCDGTGNCVATGTATNCPSGQYCSTASNECTARINNSTTACTRDIQCLTGKCCGTCVNTASDNNNCGSCENKCGPNRTCRNSSCDCTDYTFPATCGRTCGSWNFESGPDSTEGWSLLRWPTSPGDANGASNAVITTSRPAGYPGSGSYSLRVPVAINGSTSYTASVGNIFCPNSSTTVGGFTISGYVYLTGPTLPLYAIVAAYSWSVTDATNDYQTILLSNAGDLTIETNKWLPFSKTLVASPATNVITLALAPNGPWTGTMYLDDVKISGF